MPWNNPQQIDEGKMSEFNSAQLKMLRLDKIQSSLNEINTNLQAYNVEYGVYNYELAVSRCDALFQEVESKLNDKERVEAEDLRNKLHIFIKEFPVKKTVKEKVYPYKTKEVINKQVFELLKTLLFDYEKLVRKLLDEHGMDTKYDDDSALF